MPVKSVAKPVSGKTPEKSLEKLDIRKQFKHLYDPSAKMVVTVDVPSMNFLTIDGSGDPNTAQAYVEAVETLYGLAYNLKFASKKIGKDYQVLPLEGLWWMDDMGAAYGDVDFTADKSRWKWTMIIMQPDVVTRTMVDDAIADLQWKKNPLNLGKVRFESFQEGLAAQIMHIGPYRAEKPNIDRIHAYITESGHEPTGKHHEIYLGDPRKTQPEKLKTVIRQPMKKIE
ncbi:MAG TPA: GyrI-like domain-containing protein [Phototrophicaceae bacterium]|jgi:hypothetical protein|nr:GyrI-like domain-containing protein [Phototrophicaceae bacterium]